MKKLTGLIILLMLAGPLSAKNAEKKEVLSDLLKPTALLVQKDYIYVTEFPSIYIYSAADFSLLKKFGKAGEGPQEFSRFVIVRVAGNRLLVNSMGKLSEFSLDGKFIKEKKTNPALGINVMPVGDCYVGRGFTVEDKVTSMTVNLFDSNMKKIKELARRPAAFQRGKKLKLLKESFTYETDGKKIFLVSGEDFTVEVFDAQGKKLSAISRDYSRVKFTEQDRKNVDEFMRTNPRQKAFYDMFKKIVEYPDYYPAIASIYPQGGVLHIMTFNRQKDSYELFLYKVDGTFVKRIMVPFRFVSALQPFPANFFNGKLYQIIENEDEEEWELFVNSFN